MSRSARLIGTVLGLENEDGQGALDGDAAVTITTGETVVVVEPLSTEGTEGEATVEVTQAEAEVTEVADEVETMQENVEALENMAAQLRADIAAGGLTPQAVNYFNAAHAAIAGRHMNVGKRVLAAESFGSASSRLQMTQDAHESVMESIKNFIKGIIAFVKKQVTKVIDFFKNIFGSKARLKKRIDALEKAAANAGTELKDKDAKLSLNAGLTIGGKAPGTAELVKGFANIAALPKVLGDAQETAADLVNAIVGDINGKKVLEGKQVVLDVIAGIVDENNSGTFDETAIGTNQIGVALTDELLGSKVVVNVGPKKSSVTQLSIGTALSMEGIKLVDSKKGLKVAEKLEIKPLTGGDCLAILKSIRAGLDAKGMGSEKYKKLSDKADEGLAKLNDMASNAKEDQAEAAATLRGCASGLSGLISNVGRGLLQAEAYGFRTMQLGANLVAASVAAYK